MVKARRETLGCASVKKRERVGAEKKGEIRKKEKKKKKREKWSRAAQNTSEY